jgi:hypothetical protein
VLLSFAAAVLGWQVHTLAARVARDESAALVAWAASLGPPVAFYAFHVYTEVPSAAVLASALAILLGTPGTAPGAAAGALTSLLPWLHVKMSGAALALCVLAFIRLRGRPLAAFALAAGLVALAYAAFLHSVYGRPSPLASYGGLPRDASGSPLRVVGGLLLDRSFGLLPHAPVFLLALPGIAMLLRRRSTDAWPHVLVALGVLGPLLTWRMWWGGQCPPARFLVPLVPFLALAVALAVRDGRGLARWRWTLLGLGLALALFMSAQPGELLFLNRGDRPTRLWAALSGATPAGRYLPSLVAAGAEEVRVAAVWTAAFAVLVALDRLAQRHEAVDRLFRGLGLPVLLSVGVGVLVDLWARSTPTTVPTESAQDAVRY